MAHHLYRHFDATGRLLYVGISLSAIARLAEHRREAHWFNDIRRVDIQVFDTLREAAMAERIAIRNEHPLHNIYRYAVVKVDEQGFAEWFEENAVLFNADKLAAIFSLPVDEINSAFDLGHLPWRIFSGQRVTSMAGVIHFARKHYKGDTLFWSIKFLSIFHAAIPDANCKTRVLSEIKNHPHS